MSKVISKNWWIVKEKKEWIVKHLTWKERDDIKVLTTFYWDNPNSAEIYRDYLINRHKEE